MERIGDSLRFRSQDPLLEWYTVRNWCLQHSTSRFPGRPQSDCFHRLIHSQGPHTQMDQFVIGKGMASNPCSHQGLFVQFPFWLKDQPYHCGYPGFELSCTQNNQTMLELPSQYEDYTTFNCIPEKSELSSSSESITCLSTTGNPVYGVRSSTPFQYLDRSSCHLLYKVPVPYTVAYILHGDTFSLAWSDSKIYRLKKIK